MIGLLRFLLALAVIVAHLNDKFSPFSGVLAVFGFYTVSGFLIARVLDTTYRANIPAFLANRALRIYPSYFVAALLGLLIALSGGTTLNPAIAVPTADTIWRQVSIFGLLQLDGQGFPVRLVPPAWSLNMELAWYLAMVVLTRFVGLWLLAGIAIVIAILYSGNWATAYYMFFGPTLCFAAGAAVYRYRIKLGASHILPAFASLLLLVLVANSTGLQTWMLYASSIATAYALACVDFRHPRFKSYDKWLGDLAYPMFLCHWQVASFFGEAAGWPLLLTSLLPILAISGLLVLFVERNVEKVRAVFRPGNEMLPAASTTF